MAQAAVQPGQARVRGRSTEVEAAQASATAARRAAGSSNRWLVLVTAVFGAFATILDGTIVNTAIPKLQSVFGADLHQISYVNTGYTMAQGVVIAASGYLANRFGLKRIYLLSLTLFTAGSVLCGLSWDTASIIFFRVLQGAGGAALFPLSFALIFASFAPHERGRANGFFGIPILFAPAIGPSIGGYLVQYADWRWVFFVNLPVGILGVLLGRAYLPEIPGLRGLRFDLRGFLIVACGLGLLLYGLSNLAYDGWSSTSTVSGPVLLALVLLIAWVPIELRTAVPLLDLRLFTRRNYLVGTFITLIATIGLFGPSFLMPQFLQNLRGLDPYPAGLLLVTGGLGTLVGTLMAGALYNRAGPRLLITAGVLLTVGGSVALRGWATMGSAFSALPLILFVRGLGLPLMLQSAATAGQDGIDGRAVPGATTLGAVARSVTAAFTIAVFTNTLQTQRIVHQAHLAAQVTLSDPATSTIYARLVASLQGMGMTLADARTAALGRIARLVGAQAAALAFQDVFTIAALAILPALVGWALHVSRYRPGAGLPAAAD